MAMDILKAAASEPVMDLLRAIEDKLYETGVLVSATGDAEADVTLAFRQVTSDAGTIVAMTIQVATRQPLDPVGRNWEPLRHHVLAGFASLQDRLPEDLRERLLDCPGALVFVNGTGVDQQDGGIGCRQKKGAATRLPPDNAADDA